MGPSPDQRIVAFVRFARSRGLQVPGNRALDVIEALTHVNASARDDVYHACRTLLVCRRDDLPIFDQAFRDFWSDRPEGNIPGSMPPSTESGDADPAAGRAQPGDESGDPALADADEATGMWSDVSRIAGKDFAALAKEHSQDPGSAEKGGDLGFFQQGQMVGPFNDVAFKLAPGTVSDLVETEFGFHIIKVAEKQAARTVPLEEVRPQLEQYLERQNREQQTDAFVNGLKAKGKIDILI